MTKEYALYRGDELLEIGTAKELAESRGVKIETIYYYASDTYQRKQAKAKKPKERMIAIVIEDDDDDENQTPKQRIVKPVKPSKPRRAPKQYAFFKGQIHLFTGSAEEIAMFHGITISTVRMYASPSYQKRLNSYKNGTKNRYIVVPVSVPIRIGTR